MKSYTLSTEEVLKNLDASAEGLSTAQAKERLEKYGPNKLKEAEANIMLLSIKLEYEQKITALHTYYTKAKEE